MDAQESSVNSQFTKLAHSWTLFDMKCLLCHDWLFCYFVSLCVITKKGGLSKWLKLREEFFEKLFQC